MTGYPGGPAQLVRDVLVLTCEAVGGWRIACWSWTQIAAVYRDLRSSVRRYADRRDALARAVRPTGAPRPIR